MTASTSLHLRWIWPAKLKLIQPANEEDRVSVLARAREREQLILALNRFAIRMRENHPSRYNTVFEHWGNEIFIKSILSNELCPFAVAVVDGEIVGALKLNIARVKKDWVGEVAFEMVDPAFRKKGIADRMSKMVVGFSRKYGIREICLNAERYGANWQRYEKWSRRPRSDYSSGEKMGPIEQIEMGRLTPSYTIRIRVTPRTNPARFPIIPRKRRVSIGR